MFYITLNMIWNTKTSVVFARTTLIHKYVFNNIDFTAVNNWQWKSLLNEEDFIRYTTSQTRTCVVNALMIFQFQSMYKVPLYILVTK